ncbi:hypothetical protein [Hoeflea halophila]|nr:hypothetical protein [Hoeflea halophila]
MPNATFLVISGTKPALAGRLGASINKGMHEMEYSLWFFAVAIGPVVLAAAMIYGLAKKRRLSRGEKIRRDQKTAELYSENSGRK